MLPRINAQEPNTPPWEQTDIVVVGEAPGKDEVTAGIPFVGQAGKLLDQAFEASGIVRAECYITNVFLLRPPNNKVAHFFIRPTEALENNIKFCRDLPPFDGGMYLKKEYLPELERLVEEVSVIKPKAVIALGNTALWAFTGIGSGITNERGNMYDSQLVPSMVVFPTYHPAYVLRNKNEFDTVVSDLKRVRDYVRKS